MSKPSILFLNRVYPPNRESTGRLLRDLAQGFAQTGWDVTVIATGPKAVRERDGGVRILRVKAGEKKRTVLFYMFVWLKIYLKARGTQKHDIVVTMTDPPLLALCGDRIARKMGSKHMHWCQDVYPDLLPVLNIKVPEFLIKRFKKKIVQALKRAEKVVVIGRCMAQKLAHNGVPATNIALIPNWPDRELVVKKPAANKKVHQAIAKRTKHAVNRGAKEYDELRQDSSPKFRVLYSGNLGLAHPTEALMDAAAILYKEHPEVEFIFVGDSGLYDDMAKERDKRLLENIKFLPWQPNARLKDLMESGDLHLVIMRDEAEGLLVPSKLYPALAVSRPVLFLGPKGSEVAQVVNDFKAGHVIEKPEGQDIADAIGGYLEDSDLWFKAQDGAKAAGNIYTPKNSIKAWIDRAMKAADVKDKRRARRKRKRTA